MPSGGAGRGQGRKSLLPYEGQIALGCACEQLWLAISNDRASETYERLVGDHAPELRRDQEAWGKLSRLEPSNFTKNHLPILSAAIAEEAKNIPGRVPKTYVDPDTGESIMTLPVWTPNRPYKVRAEVIEAVRQWAPTAKVRLADGALTRQPLFPELVDKTLKASYVDQCWRLFCSLSSAT